MPSYPLVSRKYETLPLSLMSILTQQHAILCFHVFTSSAKMMTASGALLVEAAASLSPKRSRTKFVPSKKRRPANRSLHLGYFSNTFCCCCCCCCCCCFVFWRCSLFEMIRWGFPFFFVVVMFVVLRCHVSRLNVMWFVRALFFTNLEYLDMIHRSYRWAFSVF